MKKRRDDYKVIVEKLKQKAERSSNHSFNIILEWQQKHTM